MSEILIYSQPSVQLKEIADQRLIISSSHGDFHWKKPSPLTIQCLKLLSQQAITESFLFHFWTCEKKESAAHFYYFLENLKQYGLLCYQLKNKKPIATLRPMIFDGVRYKEYNFDQPIQWSRAGSIYYKDDHWMLETPFTSAEVILHDLRYLRIIDSIAKPKSLDEVLNTNKTIPKKSVVSFLSMLQSTSLLEEKKLSENKREVTLSDCFRFANEPIFKNRSK